MPFGIIWGINGIVFLLVESMATRATNPNPENTITLTPGVLVFALVAVFCVGLIIGILEVYFFENLFRAKSFTRKLIYKTGVYVLILFIIISITFPIAASLDSGLPITDTEVLRRFLNFLGSLTFASTALQMAVSLFMSLFYSQISDNLGYVVLTNMLTGKYHQPKKEIRIFMFLDMKSSTSIAEKIGHTAYYNLLRDYYNDLSDPIVHNLGEVYQYIGDEIVISWPFQSGMKNNACIQCFFQMKKALNQKADSYRNTYGICPEFKAGIHYGEVTTGEIGALKKEIIFTGDVLNTTSRIQNLCNSFDVDLLISGSMEKQLSLNGKYTVTDLGTKKLSGRKEYITLFTLKETGND